ncbi:MAG TPA: hypothetical protein VN634_04015 [Candidatus Limnocylindrales bacterium]|nr:hypothetical protein [Candidatus Limnocylindrales bacterium]
MLSGLAFAPLIVLALLVAALRTGQRRSDATLREDVLVAALVLGVAIALGTETLSAFHAVTYRAVVGFWLVAVAGATAVLAWRWRRDGAPAKVRIPPLDAADRFLVGGVAALALVLLVVAALAPPQSSDSVGYHMSRVMHWIQNRSLAHYPTWDPPQLFEPPLAEMVRLHLQLLSGGDRAGCLLQWFAAMGALGAASLLARDLGGNRRAQLFAAVFAVTLPIGITQASSGKNGWVEALWLLSLAHFGGLAGARGSAAPSQASVVCAFAALGLELMTKITSWLFAAPVVALALIRWIRSPGRTLRHLAMPAVAGTVLVCALVLPYLGRNFAIYGHPLADPVYRAKDGIAQITPASIASNVVRNAFFQLGTDSAAINQALLRCVVVVHHMIGADAFDPETSQFRPFRILPPTRIEELAFSPLHILLFVGVGIALLVLRPLRAGGSRLQYLAAIGCGYVLFCAAVRWQGPGCRLLMPLLVLASPLVAVVASDIFRRRAMMLVACVLFVASLPYAVGTFARPLSFEAGKGILVTPRHDLYFARLPWSRATYEEVARVVRRRGARNLGVIFTDTGPPEYLLWMLLEDGKPAVRIENVAVTNASGSLATLPAFREFRPEIVVVLGSPWKKPDWRPEIVAAGTRFVLVRRFALAGFYEPATGDG